MSRTAMLSSADQQYGGAPALEGKQIGAAYGTLPVSPKESKEQVRPESMLASPLHAVQVRNVK